MENSLNKAGRRHESSFTSRSVSHTRAHAREANTLAASAKHGGDKKVEEAGKEGVGEEHKAALIKSYSDVGWGGHNT